MFYGCVSRIGIDRLLFVSIWKKQGRILSLFVSDRHIYINKYSYVVEFYHRETSSVAYGGCVWPVWVNLNLRIADDIMKTLPSIVKRQAGRPRKQRTSSLSEFKSSSRCSNCICKDHNSRTCKVEPINQKI